MNRVDLILHSIWYDTDLCQYTRWFPTLKKHPKIFLTKLNKKRGLCLSVWITYNHIKNWLSFIGFNCIEYFIVIFIHFNHIYLIYFHLFVCLFIHSTFHSSCHKPTVSKARTTEYWILKDVTGSDCGKIRSTISIMECLWQNTITLNTSLRHYVNGAQTFETITLSRKVDHHSPNNTEQYPRRTDTLTLPLQTPQIFVHINVLMSG
jgi:hypothetical protein